MGLLVGLSTSVARAVAPTRCSLAAGSCGNDFSVADFFKDSPWLNVPNNRVGKILVEPLYPRGGLLGGASTQDSAPKSKLAALAAARRNKENQKSDSGQTSSSIALLDKLGGKSREQRHAGRMKSSNPDSKFATAEQAKSVQSRRYLARQPPEIAPLREQTPSQSFPAAQYSPPTTGDKPQPDLAPVAAPSAFARTISGSSRKHQEPAFALFHYNVQSSERHTEFDFAGPSPDDIVTKAQKTKGAGPKSAKQPTKVASDDKSVNGVVQAIGDVSIEDTKVRGKNLDVLAEFEKSKPRNAANFVVIGTRQASIEG